MGKPKPKRNTRKRKSFGKKSVVAAPPAPSVAPEYAETKCLKPDTPKGWECALERSRQNSESPYQKIAVPKRSKEFEIISELLSNDMEATKITRVVNAEIWRKFLTTYEQMFASKSSSKEILISTKMPEKEAADLELAGSKFKAEAGLPPFRDNVALLFHGTNNTNLDDIFSHGLDERLSNFGRLGRALYFTDNPVKAANFATDGTLLLFGVILGDCIRVEENWTAVREPMKSREQKRTVNDIFFNSITSRPLGDNEYAIFNRTQCYPFYVVNYRKRSFISQIFSRDTEETKQRKENYSRARDQLQSFGWKTGAVMWPMWPFHAERIFALMEPLIECYICCNEYTRLRSNWRCLPCKHSMCENCAGSIEKLGTTMSGELFFSLMCPVCGDGKENVIGSCPNGTMSVHLRAYESCPGHEFWATYEITYVINDSRFALTRYAYVPASGDGVKLIGLLRSAFNRRLVFAIGTSLTTLASEVLVWNISHKTTIDQEYGYPDETYFDRVFAELKCFGIE